MQSAQNLCSQIKQLSAAPFPRSASLPTFPHCQPTDPPIHQGQSNKVLSCSSSPSCLYLHLHSHGSTWSDVAHEPLCATVWRVKFNALDRKPLSCGPPSYVNSIFPLSFMMFSILTRKKEKKKKKFFFFSANIHPVSFFQHKVLSSMESKRAVSTQCSCSQ